MDDEACPLPGTMNAVYATCLDLQRRSEEIEKSVESLRSTADPQILREMQQKLCDRSEDLKLLVDSIEALTGKAIKPTTIPQRVFDIPELLEHILLQLRPRELLKAYGVNRQFFNAIQGSRKLQRKLGLQPASKGPVSIPASRMCHSWIITTNDFEFTRLRPDDRFISINIRARSLGPKLGTRCRAMLVCQPPVQEMKVTLQCCSPRRFRHSPRTPVPTVSAKPGSAGVTLGDIQDMIEKLIPEHRLCPLAAWSAHDAQGFVKFRAEFEAEIEVDETDPLLLEKKADVAKIARGLRTSAPSQLMQQYLSAKRDAWANGLDIPTLAEFKETLAS